MIITGTKFYELATSLQCNNVLGTIRGCDKTLSKTSDDATLACFGNVISPLSIYFKAGNDETLAKLTGEKHRRVRSNNVKSLMSLSVHENHLRIGSVISTDAYQAGDRANALKVRTRYDSLSIMGSHSEIGARVLQILNHNVANRIYVVFSFWFLDLFAEIDLLALTIFNKFNGDESTYKDRVCIDGNEYTSKERSTPNRVIQVTDLQAMIVPVDKWSIKQAR